MSSKEACSTSPLVLMAHDSPISPAAATADSDARFTSAAADADAASVAAVSPCDDAHTVTGIAVNEGNLAADDCGEAAAAAAAAVSACG